jgi:hypothetical protein
MIPLFDWKKACVLEEKPLPVQDRAKNNAWGELGKMSFM